MQNYRKYRWFYTSTERLVVGGKSAKQNDELLSSLKNEDKDYVAMHTSEPGSPFCVILSDIKSLSQHDIRECAIFTGCFSKSWKEGKRSTKVDIFKLSQLHKSKKEKEGAWGVYGKVQRIIVPLELVIVRQKNILRAVPETSAKGITNLVKITPGSITKDEILPKLEIEINEPLSRDEVLSALPSGPFKTSKVN